MTKARELPSQEYLNECFDYNPDTGELHWKYRPLSHFANQAGMDRINARCAGKPVKMFKTEKGYFVFDLSYKGTRQKVRLHRLAYYMVTGEQPEQLDHINNDKSDNRLCNLRPANNKLNSMNKRSRRKLPTGVFEVETKKMGTVYKVDMYDVNGTHIKKRYYTLYDAIKASDEIKMKKAGEYFNFDHWFYEI